MPRKPIDYSRTIIYKIVSKDLNISKCYVGHTTDFTNRKRQHKSICNNSNNKAYNSYVYSFIRENGGFENFDMIEVEKFSCSDVNEAHKQERYWIETLNAELNQQIPTRTIKEYRENNREYILEKKKEYYEQNKIYILEQRKIYKKNNRDEINRKRREQRALKKA
jgi:hypothetical protein